MPFTVIPSAARNLSSYKARRKWTARKRSQEGIALLIAIFVLLLIGVMAIALIISSNTETALAGNYRSSSNAYYAAIAGLEEVRSRLRNNTPNSFRTTDPNFLPPSGTPLPVCSPIYLINPLPGEAVVPWDPNPANPYFDSEFSQEFPIDCGGANPPASTPAFSVWNRGPLNGLGFPGPLYKWVRINGVTEQSLNLDTVPIDGIDPNHLIYYDGTNLTDLATGNQQVFEVTALAVLPNNSRKLLQYLVAPLVINLPTPPPAALTLLAAPGANNVSFSSPTDPNYNARGIDQDTVGSCSPGGPITAIGVLHNSQPSKVIGGIKGRPAGFTGSSSAPDVQVVSGSFPQTPLALQALVQSIIQNADATISPPPGSAAFGSSLPSAMYSPSPNPMTVVVQGDLDLTGWGQTGYGLLLVTGNLTYDPSASWRGVILVIGQGTINGLQGNGRGAIDGAVFVANPQGGGLGPVSMTSDPAMSGDEGIHYSSCWVKAATPGGNIKILSFHEIAQ